MENNEEDRFYKARSWDLLVAEIRSLKDDLLLGLKEIRSEVQELKDRNIYGLGERIDRVERKMYWVMGAVAVIIFIGDYLFRYLIK